MNKPSRFIMHCILIGMGAMMMVCPSFGQGNNNPATQSASSQTKNATGNLGNIFAKTLQNLLQNGKLFVPNGQTAQPSTPEGEGEPEKFKLSFNNAPIDQVLKFLSDLKNKVVLKSNEVQGQFTIMNPKEVTAEEAMNIIDAAFGLQGITYIETDQMLLVLTIENAKKRGVDVEVGTGEDETGARVTSRVIELKYASPSQLREDLGDLMPENANVIADDRTRSLIITDTASNISRLETIIRELDKPGFMEGVAVRVFKLKYLNASEMARDLDDILENIVNSKMSSGGDRRRGRSNANVEVMGDRSTNSLIISAPQEAIDEVAKFIERLDVSSSENLVHKTITLKNGDAQEIAQGLNELLRSRMSSNYRPSAFADPRTNSIVISAYQEDVDSVKEILTVLDAKKSLNRVTRVFPLENADAIILSEMLQQLIGGEESSQNRYSYYYYSRRGNEDDDQIKIIEDQRLNALIVTAKPSDIEMVSDLIKELDQPLPISKEEPRVYPVQYARASDMAYMINELFSAQQTGGGFFSSFNQQQNLTGLSGKIKVIADTTTNSVIVIAGTPRAFDVVESLINQLDRKAPEFGTTQIFKLNNADAEYLSQQLNELFQDQGGQGGNQGFFWYLNNSGNQQDQISNLIGNVRIVPETRTNSLLVTSNAQYFEPIGNLLEELDREISQILIEILIVEVSDVKDNQFGINWPDDIPITTEGELSSSLSDLAMDKATILTQTSFTTVLDILSKSDKTSVVARPNILTGDNQRAYVEIITEVPVLGETTLTDVGVSNEIIFREPGLKLSVNPHINDATTVTIEVDLETGQVDERVALTIQNTSIPGFSRRKVETRLTIEDNETAVLSGVIDTSYSERENGVPVLMHIPLLGEIFKSRGTYKTKTELLTFITPYIVTDAQDRLEILKRQSERIEVYEGFREQMKNVDVEAGIIDNMEADEKPEPGEDMAY